MWIQLCFIMLKVVVKLKNILSGMIIVISKESYNKKVSKNLVARDENILREGIYF